MKVAIVQPYLRLATQALTVISLWLCGGIFAFAQTGVPLIKNYAPKEIDAAREVYGVAQDKRGVMYFANPKGVLEYDGVNWRLTALPNGAKPQALAVNDSGVVFIGGENEMGYLAPDAGGKLGYVSLVKKAPAPVGDISTITVLKDGVYFATKDRLWRWDRKTVSECKLVPAKNARATQNLMTHPGWGLVTLAGTTVKKLAINAQFKYKPIVAVEKYDARRVILATQTALYLYDNRGLAVPYKNGASYYFQKNIISDVKKLLDGSLAVATSRGGVAILHPTGRLDYVLNQRAGLQNETVHKLWLDKQGGLWMALDAGVSRSEVSSAVRKFEDNLGLKGSVNAIAYYDNIMYVGTERGLFYLNTKESPAAFRAVNGIIANTFSLVPNKRSLFAATNVGVYKIDKDTAEIVLGVPATALLRSRANPDQIYVGLNDGFGYLKTKAKKNVLVKMENGKPKYRKIEEVRFNRIDSVRQAVGSMEMDKYGRIWLSNESGITRLNFRKGLDSIPEMIKMTKGLPGGEYRLFSAKGDIKVCTQNGIYRYDPNAGFIPDSSFGLQWLRKPIYYCYETAQGDVILSGKGGLSYGKLDPATDQYKWDSMTFVRYPDVQATAHLQGGRRNDPVYWIGHTEGLLRFEPRLRREIDTDFFTLIRKTTATFTNAEGKRVLFFGTQSVARLDSLAGNPIMAHLRELDKIRFEFAAVSFDDEEQNRYQYRLVGLDSAWSDWTNSNFAEFGGIPFGNYVFQVRSGNIYGAVSRPAEYAFTVNPLWYQTPWAKAAFSFGGLFGFALMFVGGVRYYSYRLQMANRRLQSKISEATHEIRAQNLQLAAYNEEIKRQKEIIEEKNVHITDSILYAKRIQEAILPKHDQIKQVLPNYFIFFRPRDQVSGDFYWFTEINGYTILAAGDCTGHGVPGALMSMVGSSLLNKIVNENEVTRPATILEQLHQGIHISLRQYEENTNVRDGIDICISTIDFKARALQLASANRPIYWVKKGEFFEITGDKYSVGGPIPTLPFTNHVLSFERGDTLYMFSDGYVDQFGGANHKKFQTRRFRELLLANQHLSLDEQCAILEKELREWQGAFEQVDDILVVGIRF